MGIYCAFSETSAYFSCARNFYLAKKFILRTLLVNDALVFICIVCYVDRNHKWINLYVRSMINMNIFHK